MVEFKLFISFLGGIDFKQPLRFPKNIELFAKELVVSPDNGIVKHFAPFVHWPNLQYTAGMVLQKIVGALGHCGKYFDEIKIVANHCIVNPACINIPKSQIESVFADVLEQYNFPDAALWPLTREKVYSVLRQRLNVVSLPQHVLIFCSEKRKYQSHSKPQFFFKTIKIQSK